MPAFHPPNHGAHAIYGLGTIRIIATLILTFVILVVFLVYLLSSTIFGNLFEARFYTASFSENRIYERFYDEVLLDEEAEEVRADLLGSIEVVSNEDIVRVSREILPPDYLQGQVETSIESLIGYLDGDEDSLELLIDLGPPLERAKPVLLGYIDEQIDQVPEVTVRDLEELEASLELMYGDLSEGRLPSFIPRIDDPPASVGTSYDLAVRSLEQQGGLSQESLDNLDAQEGEIKALLAVGDVKGSLKLASRSIAGPFIDESTEDIRSRLLDPGDGSEPRMLDLVQWAADEEGVTREALLEDWGVEDAHNFAGRVDQGEAVVLAVLALVSILVVLTHLPRVSTGLVWVAGILMTVGSIGLILGVVMRALLPAQVEIGINEMLLDSSGDVPASAVNIAGDVLQSMVKDAAVDWVITAVIMVVAGAMLLALALLTKRLSIPVLSR